MTIHAVWLGAATDTSVWVRCYADAFTGATLTVSEQPDYSSPLTYGPVGPNATTNVIGWQAGGLTPDTRYYYIIDLDGSEDAQFAGTFLTHPAPAGSRADFIIGAAGDAGLVGTGDGKYIYNAVSDNPVFDTMREQARAENWSQFAHLGDLHYRNIATNDVAAFRDAYYDNLNADYTYGNPFARQGMFFRDVAATYVWDDHDFGPNNSDRTSASRPAAQQAYREWVPHYDLPDPEGIYQSWQIGRVLFIASDVRSFRDPNSDPQVPSKTMLGAAQKTWMEQQLLADTGAAALVWISPSRWVGGSDTWDSFRHERDEMVQLFGDTGWLDRMIFVTADEHALSLCSARHNGHGGFPMYMFASLDASYGSNQRTYYDLGQSEGRQRYGTIRVTDSGHTIALTGTGYINGSRWKANTTYVEADRRVLALDYAAGHISPPFHPVDDDQRIINDATATRERGGEVHVRQETGPLSVQAPPDGVGTYDTSATLNVHSDEQLRDWAGWQVHLGTVDEPRYPRITVDLGANPDLADEVASTEPGDLITVANPPPWLPPDDIHQVAEGATETVGPFDWRHEFTASPASPWTVAQALGEGEDPGTDRPNRADTTGSQLAAEADEDDTLLLVHTPQDGPVDRALWVPSALLPGEFPFDVRVGGEVMRATTVEPGAADDFGRTVTDGWGTADSGQVWDTTGGDPTDYSVASGTGVIVLASSPTTLRFGQILEEHADCELLASVSADQIAADGTFLPGLFARAAGADFYWCNLALQADGKVGIEVRSGVNVVGSRVVTNMTYSAGTRLWLRVRVEGHRVLGRVWLDGKTELSGWQIDRTITSNTVEAGAVGVAVASTGTNVSPTFAYDDFRIVNPQRMTVQRSINTVVKPHEAGTAVSLAQPATFPL